MLRVAWIAIVVGFVACTNRCGKHIEKREWAEAVFWSLISLGIVLLAVKSAPVV